MDTQVAEQAPTPSVEDRLNAILTGQGKPTVKSAQPPAQQTQEEQETEAPTPEQTDTGDEAAGDEVKDHVATAEDVFELEVDGEKYALPKKLEKALMNERDYTQKSQKNSEMRKQLEHLHETTRVQTLQREFENSIAPDLQQLRAYDDVLKDARNLDWANMPSDELMRRRAQLDQWKGQRDEIAQQLQVKYQQWSGEQQKAIEGLRSKASELAAQFIPNWSDNTKKAVRDHAISDGYTETELSTAELDPRHWKTLWKAQQFDLLKSKASKTVADVKQVKTTPSNPMPKEVKEKLAYRKEIQKHKPGSREQQQLVQQRIGKIFG